MPIRGNVETRLNKLAGEEFDALVLAEAGIVRLGLGNRISEILDSGWMLPAVGQGALGLECRLNDVLTKSIVEKLDDPATRASVTAERALLHALGAGCQVPLGALGIVLDQKLVLRAAVLDQEGCQRIEAQLEDTPSHAEELGRRLATQLMSNGADKLLPS
jgi:hydroxymethylbilane synthase